MTTLKEFLLKTHENLLILKECEAKLGGKVTVDLVNEIKLHRAYRGGSFRDEPAKLRGSAGGAAEPDSKIGWRGFRVVLEI